MFRSVGLIMIVGAVYFGWSQYQEKVKALRHEESEVSELKKKLKNEEKVDVQLQHSKIEQLRTAQTQAEEAYKVASEDLQKFLNRGDGKKNETFLKDKISEQKAVVSGLETQLKNERGYQDEVSADGRAQINQVSQSESEARAQLNAQILSTRQAIFDLNTQIKTIHTQNPNYTGQVLAASIKNQIKDQEANLDYYKSQLVNLDQMSKAQKDSVVYQNRSQKDQVGEAAAKLRSQLEIERQRLKTLVGEKSEQVETDQEQGNEQKRLQKIVDDARTQLMNIHEQLKLELDTLKERK